MKCYSVGAHRRAIALLLAVAFVIMGLPALLIATASKAPATPSATILPPDAPWLTVLNYFRSLAGEDALIEWPNLSYGDALHANYMLQNHSLNHIEDPQNPYYTPQGAGAGQVSLGYHTGGTGLVPSFLERTFITGWVTGPFHGASALRSTLTKTGFGKAISTSGANLDSYAALNVEGKGFSGPASTPVHFPGDGTVIPLLPRSNNEFPSPLTSCPGYTGWGQPVYLMLPEAPSAVTATWRTASGSDVPFCEIDETNYVNSNSSDQASGRLGLAGVHEIALLPQADLVPGTTYNVVVNSGTRHEAWAFTVAGSRPTGVEVTSSLNPAAPGTAVTLKAIVYNAAGPVSGGTVTFSDGGVPIGSGTPDTNGIAPLAFSPAVGGQHQITAHYSGTSSYDPADSASYLQSFSYDIDPRGSALSGSGNDGLAGPDVTACGDPVNCFSGNFFEELTDFSVSGRGRQLKFTRTYNAFVAAAQQTAGPLGYGWTHSYLKSLAIDETAGKVVVTDGNGSTVPFSRGPSDTAYAGPRQATATLVRNPDGTYTYTLADQRQDVFSSTGALLRQTDRNGYITSMSYSNGQLASVIDPAGRTLSFTYTGSQLVRVTDPAARSVQFTYDGNGNLATVTDPAGGITRYGYDSLHRLTTVTDPRNGIVTNTYDATNRVTAQKDQLNKTRTWSYSGLTTTETDAAGNVTNEVFDTDGNLVSLTRGVGTAQSATRSYGYDAGGNQVSATDPNGNISTEAWDGRGNLLSSIDAAGRMTTYSYNARNDLSSVTDPLGVTTTLTYDPTGNLLSKSTPLTSTGQVATVTIGYDPAHPGDAVQVTDPLGKQWRYGYSGAGDLIRVENPLGQASTFVFNAIGWRTAMTSPRGNAAGGVPADYTSSLTYNSLGELKIVTDPTGSTVTAQYDASGNQTSTRDAEGHLTQFTYDKKNRVITTTRPDGSLWKTVYDAAGNVTSQVDGLNNATSYTYDSLRQLTSKADPLGRTTRYTHDRAGNLTGVIDAANQSKTLSYDWANKVTKVLYSDGTTPNVEFQYDELGRRSFMREYTTTFGPGTTYTYDSLGRLTNRTQNGWRTDYQYDLAGHLTGLVYPYISPAGARAIGRTYDAAGRMASVTDWNNHTTSFGYDADSNLTSIAYANGASASYTWDHAGRINHIAHAMSPLNGGVQQLTFDYPYGRDRDGRLTSDNPAGASPSVNHAFSYDGNGRLLAANYPSPTPIPDYSAAYDAADNLTRLGPAGQEQDQSFDAANELTASVKPTTGASSSFVYDARGNRVERDDTAPGATTSVAFPYSYDQENRLKSAPGTALPYAYDGDGLLRDFDWDIAEGLPLIIRDLTHYFITGPGGMVIESIPGLSAGTTNGTDTSGTFYYHHDQLGSTIALTDGTGHLLTTYSYDPYGTGHPSQAGIVNPFQFAGQYTEPQSGLIYMRARWYDPATGQFLSRDPLSDITLAPYGYAGNNPLNSTDPTGLYEYTYRENLGGISQIGSASQVMKVFQQNFKQVFPFPISGCNALTNGATCTLHPEPWWLGGRGKVRVGGVSSTSFAFSVLPSSDFPPYFDPAGSRVTFSTCESGGNVFLQQRGSAPDASGLVNVLAPWLANATWNEQARNLFDLAYLAMHPSANPWSYGQTPPPGPSPPAYYPT